MDEDSESSGINVEGADVAEDISTTKPPAEVVLSIPLDRLEEHYNYLEEHREELQKEPVSAELGERVLLFFTLGSAVLENRVMRLHRSKFPDESVKGHSCRIERLHEDGVIGDGLKGELMDVWKRRCKLVHEMHQHRKVNFDVLEVGKKVFRAHDKVDEVDWEEW